MKYLLNWCFILAMSTGMAQAYIDVGFVSYATSSSNSFENSSVTSKVEEFNAWVDYPIVLSDRSTLLTGVYASNLKVRLFPNDADPADLQSFGVKLGWHYKLSERESFSLILRPKSTASTGNHNSDALQLGWIALYNGRTNKGLNFRTGVYLNTESYGLLVVPLFGIYYQNEKENFELDATLPVVADINFTLPNRMALGLNFDGLGITYNHVLPNAQEVYVSKISNELFAYLRIPLSKTLFIRSKIGYSFFRKFEVYDRDDKVDLNVISFFINDDRTRLNPLTDDGFLFKFELVYRFHLKPKQI